MTLAAASAPPAWREFAAPAGWARIDFISDLHLSPGMPATLEAWAGHLRSTPADAVFILGDLFDTWVGDDARHEGFEAGCCAVLADAARRRHLGFMVGNRDFLLGAPTLAACGVAALADPTLLVAFGQRVLLTHGDALCLADTEYQRFRAQVRSPQWQAGALALPLAERRRIAAQMRHASEHRNAGGLPPEAADIDLHAAAALMHAANAPVLVHGHTHRPGTDRIGADGLRHVLSDWDLDHGARAEVLALTADGFARAPPAG